MPDPVASNKPWQEVAASLQAHRDATIAAVQPPLPPLPSEMPRNTMPLAAQFLTPEEISVTETSPEGLLSQLAAGKLSSTAVTSAFLRRAALAQAATNCITELLPEKALARAKELDAHLAMKGAPVGPLHGLPISVKEHVTMGGGLKTNAGFCAWADHKGPNALILNYLWEAGAVFYARTTQPQTLMHLETSNNIYGASVNPFNTALTCGGSSGGEGALVGFRGSCLGIGTDIGGSIRSPAANQGLWGLRPSAHRLPNTGTTSTMLGEEQIVPVIGPISTSLEGVKVFTKTLIDQRPWLKQPDLIPVGWRDEVAWLKKTDQGAKKLKIGVLSDDGVVRPHPPVLRAINEVVEKLKGVDGVEIVEWKPYKHDLAWDVIVSFLPETRIKRLTSNTSQARLYFCDGGREELEAMEASGEPPRPLTKFILHDNPHVPKKSYTASEIWKYTRARDQYRTEYAEHWNATGNADGSDMVDVILCPVGPGAAPPLDQAQYWGYTSQWNLLDYPALVFPVRGTPPS